jgi:hypothetical protein
MALRNMAYGSRAVRGSGEAVMSDREKTLANAAMAADSLQIGNLNGDAPRVDIDMWVHLDDGLNATVTGAGASTTFASEPSAISIRTIDSGWM